MKRFIIRVLLFSLCVIGFAGMFDLYLLTVDNEYSYKRRYVEENGDAIKTLILGHSHAAYGMNPEIMGDCVFNFAISGRTHHYDAVLAKRYVHTLKNLDAVIWTIGYDFQYISYLYDVRKDVDITGTHTYQCMYEKYMGISYEKYIPYLHWSECMFSSLGFATRPLLSEEGQRGCSISGFCRKETDRKLSKWEELQLPKAIDFSNPGAVKAAEEGIRDYKQIAQACKDAGVRLIVVGCPYYKTARALMTERGRKEKQQCVDSMKSVYPTLEYYEFCDDSRFEDDDFQDSSHLSYQGATKLSQILKTILDKE